MISNVNHNSLVYLDNEFTLEVQVQAFESKGEMSRVLVMEGGKRFTMSRFRLIQMHL
ncbi:hypothetical protein [Pedobacter panaciterrae]